MLDEVGVKAYKPADYNAGGTLSEEAAETLAGMDLKADLANGKSAPNLTIAFNDKELVHNLETVKAVYERLLNVRGEKARVEAQLTAIGDIFKRGNVPTTTGERVLSGGG